MSEKKYSMEDILRALDVAGIKLVSTRNNFFNALLSKDEKLTEEEKVEMAHSVR